ncbi:hypothetical protein A1E_01720 [Rickettsia canadensis str. McKiel]|uniref:Uncharacterized protein n=1 Tax=Rickettsia canadensis (strain McKiel) TaxID=293613 RepID=A8EY56_RICCK|nr:hypothetical protein A1E_01720 [Rickettsia canadensis str. McKiel]
MNKGNTSIVKSADISKKDYYISSTDFKGHIAN